MYGLENRKFQMQMGLEERKHETDVHAEILRASLKTAQEDMHRATLEVKERQLRTTRLQSKYEVMVGKRNMGGGDGDDGDHSQAYFVIKAAQVRFWSSQRWYERTRTVADCVTSFHQERELLQRTGDELDAKIRKAEKEVRALEATLTKLNDKNRLYRSSMKPVADQGRLGERQALRDQLDKAYDRCAWSLY